MTELQKSVAEHYVACNNISKAAELAGITGPNARISAWQMLQYEEVQDYIDTLRLQYQERTGITAEKVLKEAAKIAFSDIRDYYDDNGFLKLPKDLSDDAAAALAGIDIDEIWAGTLGGREKVGETKKIKLYNKLDGIEKLAKYLGLYERDNRQRVPVDPRFIIQIVPPEQE